MSTPPIVWPGVPSALVTWTRAEIGADTSDADTYANLFPVDGEKVKIRPSISGFVVYTTDGSDKITIKLRDIPCVVIAGQLVTEEGLPIFVAATDNPKMSAQGWTYSLVGYPTIKFSAPTGATVDLSNYVLAPAIDATKYWVDKIPELVDIFESSLDVGPAVEDYLAANPPSAGLGFRIVLPPGDVSTWVGLDHAAIYRVPMQTMVDQVEGRPPGAGPGVITVIPVGSTASIIEWVEFDGLRRSWRRTVGVGATGWTPVKATRRAGVALTLGHSPDVRVATDVGHVLPMSFAARIPRWRVHFRNTNDRVDNTITGALNIVGVSVGQMVRTTTGAPGPNFAPGTGKVIQFATTTPSSGSELVTDWVEDYPLDPHVDYVLRYGFTAAAGQQVNFLQGGGWSITAGSGQVHSATVAATQVKTSPLDVWIEVEVPQETPVWAYYGDSLTVGQSAALPVFDSWPSKHARANGAIPTFYAHSGSAMTEWTNPLTRRVTKYVTGLYLIDRADRLYWSMGSNDIFATGATIQQLRDRLATAWPVVTGVTSTNVIYTTILPRHDPLHPQEAVRREWNRILKEELPYGALMTVDAADAIAASAGDKLDTRWSASPTDIHLSTPGYARFAAAVSANVPASTRGDTGWQTLPVPTAAGYEFDGTGTIQIRRIGNVCYLRLEAVGMKASAPVHGYLTPSGFIPTGYRGWYAERNTEHVGVAGGGGQERLGIWQASRLLHRGETVGGKVVQGTISWLTDDPFPA